MKENRKPGVSPALRDDEIIMEVCKFIKAHLAEELTYKRIEEELFVSRYHLSAKFPARMGMSVTAYIIRQRLLCVIDLVEKGAGLEDASFRAGFNTYSHFYKKFVQVYKISPREYFKKK